MSEPPPLYDVEIEQALLGAMMVDNWSIPRAMARIRPADFFDPLHQRIAEVVFRMSETGAMVTPLTVAPEMVSDPGLIEVNASGDGSYLRSLALGAPALPAIEEYARIIADLADKRSAVAAMGAAGDAIHGADGVTVTVGQALAPILQVSDSAQARQLSVSDTKPATEAATNLLVELERGQDRPEGVAAPTGLALLDALIGGLFPGNLILVAGRPGMGKSILATSLAIATARAGWAPHLFSLEMGARECAARMLADISYESFIAGGSRPVPYQRLLHHKPMTDLEWERVIMAGGELSSLAIEINDRDRLDISQISGLARARQAQLRRRCLPIIDHLQIIEPSDRYGGRRVDEIAEQTKAAKQLAKRMDSPVVLLSQLNRGVEARDDKQPVMSDLRDSGSIEQDADVIVMLFRPAYYARWSLRQAKTEEARAKAETIMETQKHLLRADVAKNRNGPTDQVDLFVDVACSVIRDHDPSAPAPHVGELQF